MTWRGVALADVQEHDVHDDWTPVRELAPISFGTVEDGGRGGTLRV